MPCVFACRSHSPAAVGWTFLSLRVSYLPTRTWNPFSRARLYPNKERLPSQCYSVERSGSPNLRDACGKSEENGTPLMKRTNPFTLGLIQMRCQTEPAANMER